MDQAVTDQPCTTKAPPCAPFRRVRPGDVGALWAFVKNGLEVIFSKAGPQPWTADDVRDRLQDGHGALYVRDDGFVVLEQCVEPISRRKFLNVWLMWFLPGHGRRVRLEIVAWLEAMKESHACEWIEFSSPLKGWEGAGLGFDYYMTRWRRA